MTLPRRAAAFLALLVWLGVYALVPAVHAVGHDEQDHVHLADGSIRYVAHPHACRATGHGVRAAELELPFALEHGTGIAHGGVVALKSLAVSIHAPIAFVATAIAARVLREARDSVAGAFFARAPPRA